MSSPSRFVSIARSSIVEVVDAGREDGEVAAVQDREAREPHVAAELEGDRLVALPVHGPQRRRLGIAARPDRRPHAERAVAGLPRPAGARPAAREARPVDAAGPEDRHVLEPDAPDQAVLPVAVAEVLVEVVLVRLRQVVLARAPATARPRAGRRPRRAGA